jgi:hypothetical protein
MAAVCRARHQYAVVCMLLPLLWCAAAMATAAIVTMLLCAGMRMDIILLFRRWSPELLRVTHVPRSYEVLVD